MKKYLFFLFLLFSQLLNAYECDCGEGSYWKYYETSRDEDYNNQLSYREQAEHPRGCEAWTPPVSSSSCPTSSHLRIDVEISGAYCNDPTGSHADSQGTIYEYERGFHETDKKYQCTQCDDPDDPMPGSDDDNLTSFMMDVADPDTVLCGQAPSASSQAQCDALQGTVHYRKQSCCSLPYCVYNPDINTTDPDTNTTEPPQVCPNGQDINGHCCSPGETVCQGYCQLNNVPCSDEPDGNGTDPNGGGGGADTNSTDPCDYPLRDSGFPYKGHSFDQDECFNDAKLFSDVNCEGNPVNASFLKDDACAWGACYYPNWTHAPDCNDSSGGGGGNDNNNSGGGSDGDNNSTDPADGNGTGDSNGTGGLDLTDTNKKLDQLHKDNIDQTNKLTDKLSELDGSAKDIKKQVKDTGDQLAAVLNALNMSQGDKLNNINDSINGMNDNIGNKLDGIKDAINSLSDSNSTPFVPSELNASGIGMNDDHLNSFFSKLTDANTKMDDAQTLMNSVLEEFSTFSDNVESAYTQLTNDFQSYKTMFEDKPTVTISSGGSCALTASVFGKNIDFGAGLCSSLQAFSPFVVFILTIATKLSLIFIAIRFFRKD